MEPVSETVKEASVGRDAGPGSAKIVVPPVVGAGDDAAVTTCRSAGRSLGALVTPGGLPARRRGPPALFRAAGPTGAAVAPYLAAEAWGLDDPPPLVAALTG